MAAPPTEHEPVRKIASRVRVKDSHSYGAVLGLIIVLFLFADIAPTTDWATSVLLILQGLTFAVALWTSAREIERHTAAGVLVASCVLAFVELMVGHGRVLDGIVAIYAAVLTVATAAVIGRGVMRQHEINAQSVSGAVGVYLLLGIFFIFIYSAIQSIGQKAFFVQGQATRPVLLYFSYITMTTVGYGDYTAATQLGKTFAVVEALTGQLYLVTVVAILVSQFGRQRR
jgi:hypothetical protein